MDVEQIYAGGEWGERDCAAGDAGGCHGAAVGGVDGEGRTYRTFAYMELCRGGVIADVRRCRGDGLDAALTEIVGVAFAHE